MSKTSDNGPAEPTTLLTGLVIGESARWHEGRLWLSNWGAGEILAVDTDGTSEVIARAPVTIPFCLGWTPDGRLLVTAGAEDRLVRLEPDGSFVDHAHLSGPDFTGLNEIVVDGRGNIYVNGGCDFYPGEGKAPGGIALITPDGAVRQVADDLAFPNGMVVTPDDSTLIIAESFAGTLTAFDIAADGSLSNRRVWAKVPADGICLDAEGAVWTPTWIDGGSACVRVREGGEIVQHIPLDHAGFACALGGDDGRTLFMLTADWHLDEDFMDNLNRLSTETRTGTVSTMRVSVPAARR